MNSQAACPGSPDYTVDKTTPLVDVTTAIYQMGLDGVTSATICVEPDPGTASALCPDGSYLDNVVVSGGLSIDLHFRGRTCLANASTSSPTITFDGAAASSMHDFHKVSGASAATVFVQNSELTIHGRPADSSEPQSEISSTVGAAISVGYNGVVDSDTTSYCESEIGIKVHSGTGSGGGGEFNAQTTDEVFGNVTALLVSDFGTLTMHRARVYQNEYVGYVLDDSAIQVTDTRFDGNIHPACTVGYVPKLPAYVLALGSSFPAGGLVIEDAATADLLNDRWLDNCTHSDSDLALVRAYDTAELTVRNNTFDNNQVPYVILAATPTAKIWDNILADDAGVFGAPKVEIGILCTSSLTSTKVDSNVFWNLDTTVSGPCTSTNNLTGNPAFTTFVNTSISRSYHLDPAGPSSAFNASARTIGTPDSIYSSAPFTSASYGTEANDPSDPSSWVPDTNLVDIGFHWFSP